MNELTATQTETLPAVNMSDRFAKLKQQAAHPPELWQPETGESLIGELVGSRKIQTQFGENTQIIVKTEGGAIIATWLTKFIHDALKSQSAELRDFVAITFIGKRQTLAGRSYNAYSIIVDKGLDNE